MTNTKHLYVFYKDSKKENWNITFFPLVITWVWFVREFI